MIRSVTALALVAFALAACGGAREQSAAADAGDDLARIRTAKVIRVGVKADSRPFGYRRGGELVGFDVDIAQALAKELGVEAQLVPVTSADRIPKLRDGAIDIIIASTTITRTRERAADFTIPYFQDGQALLVRSDSPIGSYLDLVGRKVGAVKGSTSAWNISQAAPEATVVRFDGFATMLAALAGGSVDAITSDQLILQGLALGSERPEAYRIAGDRFSVEPYGIAVRQGQSGLRDALNEGLMALWESGRWRLIHDTWFGPGSAFAGSQGFVMPVWPR